MGRVTGTPPTPAPRQPPERRSGHGGAALSEAWTQSYWGRRQVAGPRQPEPPTPAPCSPERHLTGYKHAYCTICTISAQCADRLHNAPLCRYRQKPCSALHNTHPCLGCCADCAEESVLRASRFGRPVRNELTRIDNLQGLRRQRQAGIDNRTDNHPGSGLTASRRAASPSDLHRGHQSCRTPERSQRGPGPRFQSDRRIPRHSVRNTPEVRFPDLSPLLRPETPETHRECRQRRPGRGERW